MSLYPRLFENPNAIYDPKTDNEVTWSDTDTIPFSYYEGKLLIGDMGSTHDDMKYLKGIPKNYHGDGRGQYSGRLFIKYKIVTFWHFPENKEKLKQILQDIQDKISKKISRINFFDGEWKIEVPSKSFNKLKKYPTKSQSDSYYGIFPQWGNWHPKERTQKFVTPDEYNEKYERPPEELQIKHLIPPGAGKKEVPYGYGSKSPKYLSKREWQMATLGDESVHEPFYPSLYEAIMTKNKQLWIDLFVRDMKSKDFVVSKKPFETLRANFGPNDGTAEDAIKAFLQNSVKINPNTYTIDMISKGVTDPDIKYPVSGQFEAYKIKFTTPTTDVFGNKYAIGDLIVIGNRSKIDAATGEASVVGKKDLTPTRMKLDTEKYTTPTKLLTKIKTYINNTQYPDNYKKFIIESSEKLVADKSNLNKFEDFSDYAIATTPVRYVIPIELFEGVDATSISNIQNDYGEVLGALMFFNILKKYGKGLTYPTASNQKLIDFYFDDYKISSKAGGGSTPSGDTMIKLINDAYERGEISFDEDEELDFYNNVIKPWINPDKLYTGSNTYNTVMTLAKIHLGPNKNSAYSYLLSNMYAVNKPITRDSILSFVDNLIDDDEKFTEFITEFSEKSTMSLSKFNLEKQKINYLQKRELKDNGKDKGTNRLGLIFYPIVVEVVKYINEKYADMLTKYAQKVTDIKQIYLDIVIKKGEFVFNTQSFRNSEFVFEQKGSMNKPFNSNIGIKAQHSKSNTGIKNIRANISDPTITETEKLQSDNFYPALNEKFTEKSDPIHDMGIGYDIALQGIELESPMSAETRSLSEREVLTVLKHFKIYTNENNMIFVPKGDRNILDDKEMRGLTVLYNEKIYKIPK